jgi:hypothetical protein
VVALRAVLSGAVWILSEDFPSSFGSRHTLEHDGQKCRMLWHSVPSH